MRSIGQLMSDFEAEEQGLARAKMAKGQKEGDLLQDHSVRILMPTLIELA